MDDADEPPAAENEHDNANDHILLLRAALGFVEDRKRNLSYIIFNNKWKRLYFGLNNRMETEEKLGQRIIGLVLFASSTIMKYNMCVFFSFSFEKASFENSLFIKLYINSNVY